MPLMSIKEKKPLVYLVHYGDDKYAVEIAIKLPGSLCVEGIYDNEDDSGNLPKDKSQRAITIKLKAKSGSGSVASPGKFEEHSLSIIRQPEQSYCKVYVVDLTVDDGEIIDSGLVKFEDAD